MKNSDHFKGLLLTISAVIVLSPDALLVRLIHTDTWSLLFWRGLLSGSIITTGLALHYPGRLRELFADTGWPGVASALTTASVSTLFVCSLKLTTAANTLIIMASTPLFSSLLSWVLLKERVPLRTWVAIFISLGGILAIFSGSLKSSFLLGDLLALGATLMWAINLVVLRYGRGVNMVPANAAGNFLTVPVSLAFGAAPFTIMPSDVGYLFLLCVFVLPVSFVLITLGPKYLTAPEVSLILLAEAILGPFWVWLVVGEFPHALTLISGALIIGTLVVHTLLSLRALQRA